MWKTQVSLGKPSTTRGFPWISHMSKVDFLPKALRSALGECWQRLKDLEASVMEWTTSETTYPTCAQIGFLIWYVMDIYTYTVHIYILIYIYIYIFILYIYCCMCVCIPIRTPISFRNWITYPVLGRWSSIRMFINHTMFGPWHI